MFSWIDASFASQLSHTTIKENPILNLGFFFLIVNGCASFELVSVPNGAEVYEEEERIGVTPFLFDQFSGERFFTIKKKGYVEQDVMIS